MVQKTGAKLNLGFKKNESSFGRRNCGLTDCRVTERQRQFVGDSDAVTRLGSRKLVDGKSDPASFSWAMSVASFEH